MRGEARRERLLQEAIRCFGKRGYEGTSLEAVATAAGVRKQTLLYYFPTKETLLSACVIETSRRVAEALTTALEAETSSSRKAEAVIHALFHVAEEWPQFPLFIREASRLGPEVIERFAAVLEPLRVRALMFLQNGMNDGTIRRQDPALLLFTLYTAVVGSLTEDKGRMALRRREQELLSFVRNALGSTETPANGKGRTRRDRAG